MYHFHVGNDEALGKGPTIFIDLFEDFMTHSKI